MAQQSTILMVVLLVVGLGIGAGVGYFAAPKGSETIVEVPYEVPVEVHPLAGKTVRMGVTCTLTSALEQTVPLMDEIFEGDMNSFLELQGLDIKVDMLVEDNGGTPAIALEKTQGFKAAGVSLIIGHGRSSHCQASMAYANENDVLLVSRSSTSPVLAIADDNLFRTCPTDLVQAPANAEMLESWGIKAVLVIHRAGAYGDGLYNILTNELVDRGIEELGRIRYAIEMDEFSSYVEIANQILTEAIEEHGIERVAIQWISAEKQITIATQMSDYPNCINTIWFATEGRGRDQRRLDDAPEIFTKVRNFSSFMGADEGSVEWQSMDQRFNEKTGLWAGFYQGTEYDAGLLMTTAVVDTASQEAEPIAKILIPLSKQIHGTTGQLSLDENGDRKPTVFDIWGFYVHPDTGENTFRRWGQYDGRTIKVQWDDAALLKYAGLVRPARSTP